MRNLALAAILFLVPANVSAEPLNVVASFSILADMIGEVGGEHVNVASLVGPGEDAHVYQPVPTDVVAVANADLVVVNGLGFEGFLERLVDASGTNAPIVIAAHDVHSIALEDDDDDHGHEHHHHHDEPVDPHAWQSLEAARSYVAAIATGLCEVSHEHCGAFMANAFLYDQQIDELGRELGAAFAAIPQSERIIITSHDAFGYLARDFDLTMLAPQGLSTDAEASAADVALLIDQVRETGARALFVEAVSDPRLITQIAEETGLVVSGTLYSDALSDAEGPAGSYLTMMRYNGEAIIAALSGS